MKNEKYENEKKVRSKENAYRIYETRFEIYDNIIFFDDLMIELIIIIDEPWHRRYSYYSTCLYHNQ